MFCDLRGFTAFAETAEPEEVMGVLREYHDALGPLILRSEGTLERFAGDGIDGLLQRSDALPGPGRARRAAGARDARGGGGARGGMAQARPRLGFGVGIAQGYATLGQIGFSERRLHRDRHRGEPRRAAVRAKPKTARCW